MTERSNTTAVTSVSVTPEFHELMKQYNISPTEAFRRGMAIMLYEVGDLKYSTALNKERAEKVKKVLAEIEEHEKLIKKILELNKHYLE